MKTIRSFCNVLLAMVVITMSACSGDDDEELDIGGKDFKYHHQLLIEVCDEDGATLLNPNLKGCLDLSKITASYDGITYKLPDSTDEMSRAYPLYIYGIRHNVVDDEYFISFGYLDKAKDYNRAKVVIDWGDGTSDTLELSISHDSNNNPIIKHWLNGEPNPNNVFKIVK